MVQSAPLGQGSHMMPPVRLALYVPATQMHSPMLAAPFSRVPFCGCHRSSSLAALLTSPSYRTAIKIYPARDARARRMVLEAARDAHRQRRGGGRTWGRQDSGSRPGRGSAYNEPAHEVG